MKGIMYPLVTTIICFQIPLWSQGNDGVKRDKLQQAQYTHQYIVQQAYELLRRQLGEDIPVMATHIGSMGETGTSSFNPGHTLMVGAHREDEEDIVYGACGSPPMFWIPCACTTCSHFWDPDNGDDDTFSCHFICPESPNAFTKAKKYLFGGWSFALWSGGYIWQKFRFDNTLVQFFHDGELYYEGYWNTAGQWFQRGYSVTFSLAERYRILWEVLGRTCHLLADLSVPAHVHNDIHPSSDTYEDAMENSAVYGQWNWSDALNQHLSTNDPGGYIDVTNLPQNCDPIKYLYYTSAQIASHFASDDARRVT